MTGYDLGAGRWGGWGEYIRVPAEWVIPLPEGLSLVDSMRLGTAGFTAALSVDAITRHEIAPGSGEIVVTGATGGVGCLAVRILAKLGYSVVAVTGKESRHAWLKELGAKRVIGRAEVDVKGGNPLLKAVWAGAVDTVGGNMLATILRSTEIGGCVTACGLVGGDRSANDRVPVHPPRRHAVRHRHRLDSPRKADSRSGGGWPPHGSPRASPLFRRRSSWRRSMHRSSGSSPAKSSVAPSCTWRTDCHRYLPRILRARISATRWLPSGVRWQ